MLLNKQKHFTMHYKFRFHSISIQLNNYPLVNFYRQHIDCRLT